MELKHWQTYRLLAIIVSCMKQCNSATHHSASQACTCRFTCASDQQSSTMSASTTQPLTIMQSSSKGAECCSRGQCCSRGLGNLLPTQSSLPCSECNKGNRHERNTAVQPQQTYHSNCMFSEADLGFFGRGCSLCCCSCLSSRTVYNRASPLVCLLYHEWIDNALHQDECQTREGSKVRWGYNCTLTPVCSDVHMFGGIQDAQRYATDETHSCPSCFTSLSPAPCQ